MKPRLFIITIIVFSFMIPQAFGANEFCNLIEDLKNQEELIKDDIVLIEFLKVLHGAEITRATSVQEPAIAQTSMSWSIGHYSLDIQIAAYDEDNPSDCFFPVGYRLNAPHLPEMIGMDFHKNPQIVLNQIDGLKPKYVKGGPALEPEPEQDIPIYKSCGPGTILQDGICVVTSESKPDETNGKWESSYQTLPQPEIIIDNPIIRVSCSSDGGIVTWFYLFIVNPLCEIGIQIIPDYECNCNI